ncbi:serine carboxypeptidase-like 7 isoform X2 [Diospyros lotus]|uniref:serine carboxypeptidase-like 7 isoform X2 n=1 Tax=Diospyros lotus TaxID=55363 RepID=UPI002257CEA8|nr:serine carboxypeptidase-like 7 isoform X2 [Diospyros lotus]
MVASSCCTYKLKPKPFFFRLISIPNSNRSVDFMLLRLLTPCHQLNTTLNSKMDIRRSKAKLQLLFINRLVFFHLFLLHPLFLHQPAVALSVVESLPGFQGPLPFKLETGYIGVDEGEDVQLFYYFVKSESSPREDALVLWLTGGPGCSSFTAFAYEIGPLNFEVVQKDENLPTLALNPNSWSKVASIIFVDLPVGTGFSYGRTFHASHSTDLQACDQAYQFMRKWFDDHSEFLQNPFYVGGDSYSGITVPIIFQLMSNGNEADLKPHINLKGYILGNPVTNVGDGIRYRIPFAHGMGLISDELYESLKRSCKGQFDDVDPGNTECLKGLEAYTQCTSKLNHAQILEPHCAFASPKWQEFFTERRFLDENDMGLLLSDQSPCALYSRSNGYRLSYRWLNDDGVQEALHIRKGSIAKWSRCNYGVAYIIKISSSFPYHVNLSKKGYRSLIYSGDHDLVVPFFGTQAWIRSLNYSIVEDWRSWVVQGQVAGYARTYSNRMTFATVKGGGHTAPEYRPVECAAMFKRWISRQPL